MFKSHARSRRSLNIRREPSSGTNIHDQNTGPGVEYLDRMHQDSGAIVIQPIVHDVPEEIDVGIFD